MRREIHLKDLMYLGAEEVKYENNEYKKVTFGDEETWEKFTLSGDKSLPKFDSKTRVNITCELRISEKIGENNRKRTETRLFVTKIERVGQ
jgi:hypothetical protein